MALPEDSHSPNASPFLQEKHAEQCFKHLVENVRQEMAIVLLEGLQRTSDACTEICMRTVRDQRQALKVHMAQEELLHSLRDEHQKLLASLHGSCERSEPKEAKVFNLIAGDDMNLDAASPALTCNSEGSVPQMWDMNWSDITLSDRSLDREVEVLASEDVAILHELGIQSSETVVAHEVGVQVPEDVGDHHKVGLQISENTAGSVVGVQASEDLDQHKVQFPASEDQGSPSEDFPVSPISSFGMVLEAQARLREADELMRCALNVREPELGLSKFAADELMQSALNVREAELGLSKFASTGNSDELTIATALQSGRDFIDPECFESSSDNPFNKFEDALRISNAALNFVCQSKAQQSPSKVSISINVDPDYLAGSQDCGSPEVRSWWSEEEAGPQWNRRQILRQPGEEPSPDNSGRSDDDLSAAAADLQRLRSMGPSNAQGRRSPSSKAAPVRKQKPAPPPSPTKLLERRRSQSAIRPHARPTSDIQSQLSSKCSIAVLSANRKTSSTRFKKTWSDHHTGSTKCSTQCESETDGVLKNPFRSNVGRGSPHEPTGKQGSIRKCGGVFRRHSAV